MSLYSDRYSPPRREAEGACGSFSVRFVFSALLSRAAATPPADSPPQPTAATRLSAVTASCSTRRIVSLDRSHSQTRPLRLPRRPRCAPSDSQPADSPAASISHVAASSGKLSHARDSGTGRFQQVRGQAGTRRCGVQACSNSGSRRVALAVVAASASPRHRHFPRFDFVSPTRSPPCMSHCCACTGFVLAWMRRLESEWR